MIYYLYSNVYWRSLLTRIFLYTLKLGYSSYKLIFYKNNFNPIIWNKRIYKSTFIREHTPVQMDFRRHFIKNNDFYASKFSIFMLQNFRWMAIGHSSQFVIHKWWMANGHSPKIKINFGEWPSWPFTFFWPFVFFGRSFDRSPSKRPVFPSGI